MATRKENARKLEAMAASKPKLSGLKNMRTSSKIALAILVAVALVSILASIIAPYDPSQITMARQAPDALHLFGTDDKGRDILSRILYGGRISLVIGFGAVGFALVTGSIIGAAAAVSRKWISEVIMRILDIIMSVPGIALAAVLVTILGKSIPAIIFAIGFMYMPQIARIVRANIVSEYGEDYVRAVIVAGARAPRILMRHVLRNCAAPILVFTVTLVADAIIFEASLTFLSAGITEPTPTWGNILSNARDGVLAGRWWQGLFPGIMIMLTCLALNILSEGITDAMASAPSAPVSAVNAESRRAADLLVADPVRAYAAQADTLAERLGALRATELARTDRHIPDYAVEPLLQVKNLCIGFPSHGDVDVVENVTFDVRPGQCMALVGESGCGKSITTKVIMNLVDPGERITGEVLYKGTDLLKLSEEEHRQLLGREIAMVYQDSLSALNPSMLISAQMKQLTSRGGTRSAEELLELVGLDAKRTLESYPHELSGGQCQRVVIAMALTRDPSLVICDEPTTALDVTVQKQVIKLLNDLQAKLGFAMIFVSHDLALVAEVASEITVMYAGQIVESASTCELLTDPRHEYTQGLLGSVLSIEAHDGKRLHQVPGSVPSPADFPAGDRFAPRSSHPSVGLDVKPVRKLVAGTTDHYVYELPDEVLKANGITSRAGSSDPGAVDAVNDVVTQAISDATDLIRESLETVTGGPVDAIDVLEEIQSLAEGVAREGGDA